MELQSSGFHDPSTEVQSVVTSSFPAHGVLGRFARIAAVAALLAFVVALPSGDGGFRIVAPLFGVLLCAQLYPLLRERKPDLFSPPIYTGIYAAFATVAMIAALAADGTLSLRFMRYLREDEALALSVRTIVGMLLGLLFYYVGYYHPTWGRRASGWIPSFAGAKWNTTRLHIACIVLFALFTMAYAVFQERVGVAVTDATALAAGKAVWREDPTLSWMLRGSQLGFLAALLYLARAAGHVHRRWLLLALIILAANAWLVSRQGQRGNYMFPLVAALGIFHYLRRTVPAALFVGFLVVALAVANVQLSWRQSATSAAEAEEEFQRVVDRPTEALALHERERERFSVLALVFHEFPANRDHLLGQTYTGLIALFIPRWIWPDKVQYFQWRDTRIVHRLVGAPIPTSYLGVLYVNWSWIGIILGMALWGVFHRGMYEALNRDGRAPASVVLYMTTLLFFQPTLLGFSTGIQFVLPGYVALRFIVGRKRRERNAAEAPGWGGSPLKNP